MSLHPSIAVPDAQAPKAKRVSLILPDLGGGGAERVALTLAEDMLDAGHEVDLVLIGGGGALMPLVPPNARVIELGAKRIRNALLPLVRYFRAQRPDATQAFMWPLTVVASLAHRLAGSPGRLVISEHNALSKQYGRGQLNMAGLRFSTRLFYPLANARICVSEGSARDLAEISGLPRTGFSVIYNPVFAPKDPISVPTAVEQLWPAGGQRILTVGRLSEQKNHALLIRAFALVADRVPASLMILGEGPLKSRLEHVAQELGVADRVVFPGFTTDPWPHYASANLFVTSSDHEGYPLVLLEALLSGLNVVSTDCLSGPREILDGGRYGRLVPVGDAAALADAICESLARPLAPELLKKRAEQLSEGSLEAYREIMLGQAVSNRPSPSPRSTDAVAADH